MLKHEPGYTGRDGSRNQEPDESFIRSLDASCLYRMKESLNQPDPVAVKKDDEGHRGSYMESHEKGEKEGLRGRLGGYQVLPTQETGKNDRVTQA